MNKKQLIDAIENGVMNDRIISLSGVEALEYQKSRYLNVVHEFSALYGADREITLYSVSGRSELSGNHTDHNHGCVIAASIDLDVIAAVSPRADSIIRVQSVGFSEDIVDIEAYTSPDESRFGSSASLIAGMAAGFRRRGYAVGGFDAYVASNVLKGSGLSSSAAFEDMIGNILNHLYNDGRISNVEIAKLAQFSENVFFGKPCGLMDQVACAVGGVVAIDFSDTSEPVIEQIDFDLSAAGYRLCIVNTGGNHADLTDDYAAVPAEMKAIAAHFGKTVLRECDENEVIAVAPVLRKAYGDRSILRALHFFGENRRVEEQRNALKSGDLDRFFAGVLASGRSSFTYLQNVYTTKNVKEQGLSLALCLTERYLADKKAAFRVHGGGFAGTIQAYVPAEDVEGFRSLMDGVFGDGACVVLRIRPRGAVRML